MSHNCTTFAIDQSIAIDVLGAPVLEHYVPSAPTRPYALAFKTIPCSRCVDDLTHTVFCA